MELFEQIFAQSSTSLWEMFQEGGQANYVTWYLRVLTAGTICPNHSSSN
jgi:hypothetical protein